MITIIYSTHKDLEYNTKFKEHLLKTVGLDKVQILEYTNHNQYSLSEIYNRGINESIYDIIVCCHNDIRLEKDWGNRLLEDYANNPDFGIIGKAGSCYFPKSGIYWEKMFQTMVGQVYHHPEGQKKWLNKYSPKLPFLVPVVTIDGLFISFDKTKIIHKFDESIGKFHFYDHLFCIPNFLDKVRIGVTSSFEITHESVGKPNQEFFDSKTKFLEKWESKLPLDLKPEKIYIPEIKEKPIKNAGRVAVIIINKGDVKLLEECVKSFYLNCNPNLFDIFIADSNSELTDKEYIKNNILKLGNIKLIEYNYYNFAKISNDVVKNYIDDEYKYFLFCKNDTKVLNNVIYGMLKLFKENKRIGSIGVRLHNTDNLIRSCGVTNILDKENRLNINFINRNNYFNHSITCDNVFSNLESLIIVSKESFREIGMFNESYNSDLTVVDFNCKLLTKGLINLCDNTLVANSSDIDIDQTFTDDYNKLLLPTMAKNINSIKKHVVTYN